MKFSPPFFPDFFLLYYFKHTLEVSVLITEKIVWNYEGIELIVRYKTLHLREVLQPPFITKDLFSISTPQEIYLI